MASTKVGNHPLQKLRDEVAPRLDELQDFWRDASHKALQYIGQQPGKCLLGAVAVGFIVGRLARSWS